MKPTIKILAFGFVLVIIGAILLDIGIKATAIAFMSLGGFTIMMGPLAINIDD